MSTELAKDILNVIKIPRVKTADNISLVIEELKHFISNLVATTKRKNYDRKSIRCC
jgi:hypothetical protein